MNKYTLLFLFSTFLLFSCQKVEKFYDSEYLSLKVDCESATKLNFSGGLLSFTTGDKINLIVEGINSADLSNAESGNVNSFEGKLLKKGIKQNDADWYIVYPSTTAMSSTGVISATVPTTQQAPFDKSALVLYSNIITENYDEAHIPTLNFSLSQALGLVKISITNSVEEYSSELIENIQLSSSSILSGSYTIDIHEDSHQPAFSGYTFNRAISSFSSSAPLGVSITHTVYLFINPITINDFTLKVVTDKHIFTKESESDIDVEAGAITSFQTLDLNSFDVTTRSEVVKSVACWGDSFTNAGYSSYPNNLKELLGDNWTVFNCGKSGDRVDEVAAKQGGLGIVTNEEFTMPASGSVQVNGILRTRNNACEEGFYHIRRYSGAFSSPCLINGIECNVLSNASSYEIDDPSTTFSGTITRIGSGDPTLIPAHTPIISGGARTTKDVDLQIIYMGTNGRVVYKGKLGDSDYYDNLVNYHRYMTDFNTNKTDYLILGYHTTSWNQHYWDRFCDEFGATRMIDLRHIIPNRGRELMVRTGAYPDEASIPQSELDRVDKGEWPYCFWHSTTDVHPSEYGARAMAIVIYERMQELGYIF